MFGANVEDDFGVNLDTALANNNVGIGSNAITQSADNSGNTVWNDGYSLNNPLYDDSGRTVANQTLYSTTADKFNSAGSNSSDGLAGLKQFVNDNKALIGLAGAGSAMLSGSNSGAQKTGYQGSIPELMAGRTMITKPPTRAQGYRPGAGGIDYGGDVSYIRTPGLDPWAYLSGTSGSAAGANLGDTGGITGLKTDTTTTKTDGTFGTGTKTNVVTPGSDAYKKFIAGGGTPQGYLKTINDWLSANPNVTNAQLQAKMRELGISQTDLQTALGASKFSAAEKYALTHGMGSSGVNDSINNWLAKYPNATAKQISDAMQSVGMTMADVQDAFAANPKLSSKADQWNIMNNKGTAAVNSSINNYLALDAIRQAEGKPAATQAEKQAAMNKYGITAEDVAQAEALPLQNKAAAIAAGETPASTKDIAAAYQIAETKDTDPGAIARMVASSGLSTAQLAKDFNLNQADIDYLRGQGYLPPGYAEGGEIAIAKGRYLQGGTDGMADEIPAQIGKDQPAALSHGEFVIPADVVSHMGNGNSDAGAKKLYQMMDNIRLARTGNKKQGKQINPNKFMPGGLAKAYANGGSVKRFNTGGSTAATGIGSAVGAGVLGTETGPNSFAGDYISNMLGKTQALTESPYQQYMGPLTAGASGLQNQVFTGLQNTTFPGNLGQSFSSAGAYQAPTLGANGMAAPTTPTQPTGIASQYMNPYLQGVLDPQLAELRRQNDITNMGTNAKLTQAGAFGGGRQAIMNAENNRNLMQEMNKTVGQGYASAYDRGQQQFNAEQAQGRSLADLMAQQGNVQRGIEAEGIAADKASFEGARENPYKMLQFQQSMLQGMPISATSYNIAQPTKLQEIMAGAAGGAKAVGKSERTVADLLKDLGL